MRLRTLTLSLIAAALATLPLAGVASAQPDRDCPDFASQAEAQEALDSRIGDPERLDRDDDGEACEDHDYGSSPAPTTPTPTTTPAEDDEARPADDSDDDEGQVSVVPRGGVDTGDGSSGGSPAPLLVGAVVALAAGAAAARRRAHPFR